MAKIEPTAKQTIETSVEPIIEEQIIPVVGPSVVSGILQLKLNNRFRVTFIPEDDSIDTTALSMQVVRVSPFQMVGSTIFVGGDLSLVIDDDVANCANTVIRQLQLNPFKLVIETLDSGNTILEKYTFSGAKIVDIEISAFDYAGSGRQVENIVKLAARAPEYNKLIENLSDEAQAIYHALRNFNISVEQSSELQSSIVEKTLIISYNEVIHSF